MTIEISVPALPESVVDALLLDWKKQVGDAVSRDEILVEVETDKIILEVPAPADGVLTEIVQPSGAVVLAGEILARIGAPGEVITATATATDGASAAPPPPSSAAPVAAATPQSSPAPPASPDLKSSPPAAESTPAEQSLSPAVRRLVQEHGLDPAAIQGSGPSGRVTKEDVLTFIGEQVTPDEPASDEPAPNELAPNKPAPPTATSDGRAETREPMSRLRRTIANRLVQAQQTAALLTTFNEVDMQGVMDLRARHKDEFEKAHGTRLGYMSFFVKACVAALQKCPLVNAYIDGDDIVKHTYNDIGIAVSSPRGLVVPVLRNCESLSFADIETQIRGFGERARDGKITLDDLTGGTFTITNGGIFGSLLSTPIINPPQSAILGMHKIEERPIAENGKVVIRPMMYLALSYDHRIIDGREAVQFLVTVKETLEDSDRMLLQL